MTIQTLVRHGDRFSAPLYGQLMQNRLLVFKPVVANRSSSVYLTEKSRENPISLESNLFREKVVIDLPAGFDVDEMPEPVKIATSFGSYETAYEVVDGKLHFTRSMMTKRTVVPVEIRRGSRLLHQDPRREQASRSYS